MAETPIPNFNVKKVKLFTFFINEQLFDLDKSVRIQFQHFTNFYSDTNLISLIIRTYYSYDFSLPADNILLDFHVENIFEVNDLGGYLIKDKGYILPENLIVSLVSVSISHSRALMAQSIAGTVYQDNIIPVVNPMEVAKSFYPSMFNETHKTDLNSFTDAVQKLNKAKNNTSDKKRKKQKVK